MATKAELEAQVRKLKNELALLEGDELQTEKEHMKEMKKAAALGVDVEAMISLWAVKLESVERSADHPFNIIREVVESMKNHLGV